MQVRSRVEVRMEAIGGQGAHSAGKILAEAAVLGMDYTGNHFSSFGSEKRGSPVRSFVRFSPEKQVIRSASFIRAPDLLVVFHGPLIWTHSECLEGVHARTDLIINTALEPVQLRFPQGTKFRRLIALNATEIARKNQCGINAVMLGAVSAFCSEIEKEKIAAVLDRFFSHRSEEIIQANRAGFEAGSKKWIEAPFFDSQAHLPRDAQVLPQLGWLNAPLGGVISNPGNTILKDNSASRQGVVPRFIAEVCFHCGLCDMVCPDYCFVWEREVDGEKITPKLRGVDYRYCKACQKCIVACPVNALVPTLESELSDEEKSARLFPDATADAIRERWKSANESASMGLLSPNIKKEESS